MKTNTIGKRLFAFLLCLTMLVGIVPAPVLAADAEAYATGDTIYLLAGGDFQEAGDHANSAANVTNILAQVSQKYSTMDGFLFIGDYDCETHNDATETANGITKLMETVREKYSNIDDANSVLAQGNHDYMDSRIDATGGHDFEGYAAYVLNEDDYANGGGTQSGVQTLAANLETWLNNKLGEGYSAPIFIVSHLPLAFSPRTVTQGDAKYAKYIFDVLNDAGDNGLNIIFLHGHDHAYGPDNYMGGEAIYLAEGDKINIAETGSTSTWTEETLNFTYMNAGYTGYYSDPYTYVTNAGTDKLTMTVFAITDTQVTVERYSANGLYNLKSAGYDGSYSDTSVTANSLGLTLNSTVYASPQTISLSEVEEYGSIGEYVGVSAEATDDVTTSGGNWVTITEPVGGTTTYTYEQATSITEGEEYVIVGNDNAVALMDNSGSMGAQSVTISDTTMTSTTALTEWTFSGSSSGTIYNGTRYLRYSSSSFSLSTSSSTNFTITDNGSNFRIQSGNYSFYYNGSSWTRSRNAAQYVRLYQLTETTTTGGTDGLYGKLEGELTYNVDAGTSAEDALAAVKAGIAIKYAIASDYSDEAEFADDGEGMTWTLDSSYDGTTPGDYAVTISYNGTVLGTAEVVVPASTTYYVAEGNGLYIVAMNTSEADALAAVKDGITVSSADDASGTNKTEISDDDVTWKWIDTYNGADSGPYTVEILKDGASLGTVEVKVNIKYETGITEGWTSVGTQTGGYQYVLDTDGIDYGSDNKYIIVARDAAVALYAYSTANGTAQTITIDGTTATTTTRDYEYYFTTGGLVTRDGTNTLYQQDWGVKYGYSAGAILNGFTSNGNGYYRIYDTAGTARSLYYNGSTFTVTSEDHTSSTYSVRLYKYSGEIPGGEVYARIEGNTVYYVTQGSSATKALAAVKAGITGYISNKADGSDATELEDSALTWKWKNTFNGNSIGSYWVEISYNGVSLGIVEVKVEPGVVNNYPEYPDEGAVKVGKTATGIDFQSSGIARVELSASGVPVKKGADVIVMLDTSSSMTNTAYLINGVPRSDVLEESLKNLIAQFKTPGDDGELLDIRVAIADFNGFYSSDAYARDLNDTLSDGIYYEATSEAKVYTGDGSLGAGAFIPVEDLASTYTLNYTSGTNYDYAMDAIYQLGTAIKDANGSEDRDLYVIFMSDGAAMQWNYYHSNGRSTDWQYWITGAWSTDEVSSHLQCTEHAYYYTGDLDGDGYVNEHRMADAIKGDPSENYEVIRKTDGLGTAVSGYENLYEVPGLGATMFAIAFDPQTDQNTPPEAMEESIKTLASDQTGTTQFYYRVETADELDSAFTAIGTEIAYAAYDARFVDQMGDDFNLQMKTSTYETVVDGTTVTNTLAPVIEVLTYDIYTRQDYLNDTITVDKIGVRKGTSTLNEVVKFSEDGTKAYSNLIDVDGDGTYGVTVNTDGTYTIADTDDNIIATDGVIYAKTFMYNTGVSAVTINDIELSSETFYWKLGTVTTTELALRYYVYLDGSMEGTREAGSYPTNEYATLYYTNYLGKENCKKDTTSPVMAWKSANVSYAFYLVNENGEIIVNQTTGQTGTFANKIAITNPVVYQEILLNNTDQVQAIEVKAISDDVLPKYYDLYDEGAVYQVTINSNSTGAWEITNGGVAVDSTYVTQYKTDDASAYSNALTNNTVGDDYTHTIVWFAVVWKLQAHPDAVVIDYGLPVDISVMTNDMFGDYGKLAGIGAYATDLENTTAGTSMQTGFGDTYAGTYGDATVDKENGKVRYTPKTMQMDSFEKFAYAVNYTGATNPGYYYDTITVIPATTIYYEDSFLTFTKYTKDTEDTDQDGNTTEYIEGAWGYEGTLVEGTQDEDRPGKYSLTDANNIYGYDSVNLGMSTFSMGQARKVTVDSNSYATAEFTFYGTGFDIISMTDNDTGTLIVQVFDESGTIKATRVVDTYYGYDYGLYNVTYTYTSGKWVKTVGEKAAEGAVESVVDTTTVTEPTEGQQLTGVEYSWVVTPDNGKALYQVPVIQVNLADYNLNWGKYTVKLTASYYSSLDKDKDGSYNLFLDAVRIYDPANDGANDDTKTIENAYKADGEGWPKYIELRNQVISAETFDAAAGNTAVDGLVFIDGDASVGKAQLADYISYGPNNEIYLAPGQRVAFKLDLSQYVDTSGKSIVANVHIGLRSVDGNPASYTFTNIADAQKTINGTPVEAGTWYNASTHTLSTTTDMFYDLTAWRDDIIVISNYTTDTHTAGSLAITDIKITFTQNPDATSTTEGGDDTEDNSGIATASVLYMTQEAVTLTLRSLNSMAVAEPDPFTPEKLNVNVAGKAYVGRNVLVTATTSRDVESLTVNGAAVESYYDLPWSEDRVWITTVAAEAEGEMTIDTVAYNAEGLASEPVTKTVTVKESSGNPIRDLLEGLFG